MVGKLSTAWLTFSSRSWTKQALFDSLCERESGGLSRRSGATCAGTLGRLMFLDEVEVVGDNAEMISKG